jgi:hypothetical protein
VSYRAEGLLAKIIMKSIFTFSLGLSATWSFWLFDYPITNSILTEVVMLIG